MRVIYVSSYAGEFKIGGIVSNLDRMRAELGKRGVRIHRLVSRPADDSLGCPADTTFTEPPLGSLVPPRYHRNLWRNYCRLREEFRPDVVHVHSMSGLSVPLFERSIPVAATLHCAPAPRVSALEGIRSPLHRAFHLLRRAVSRYQFAVMIGGSDHVFVLSRRSREDIAASHPGLDTRSLEVLSPPIDMERFRPGPRQAARDRHGWEGRFVVLYVGRLVEEKRPHDLMSILPSLANDIPNLLVVFVGEGPYLPLLQQESRKLGMEAAVQFTGAVDNLALPDYYRGADIFVNPTRWDETFGIVTAEAMACGTPVVISERGAETEVVDDRSAVVFRTPEEMEAGIRRLHRNPAEGRAFAARALEHVERFSLDRSAARLVSVYREIIQGGRRWRRFRGGRALLYLMTAFAALNQRVNMKMRRTPCRVP